MNRALMCIVSILLFCTGCSGQSIERLVEESLEPSNNSTVEESGYWGATVQRCLDGDTIEVRTHTKGKKETVRILLIDTPELFSSDSSKNSMPLAEEATTFCKNFLEGEDVELEVSAKDSPYDKYGRLLAYVWKGDLLYEAKVLNEGLAIVKYIFPPDTKYLDETLYPAQERARDNRMGVWGESGYVQNGDYTY